MLLLGTGMTAARAVRALAAIRFLDAVVVVLAAMAASIAYAAGLPIVWAAAVVLVPLAIYARSRQAIRGSLDRLLLAEMRERAAMRATEAERARMAREIHDDPLQAIAGVIRFLDQPAPDADSARDALREVAARPQGVATELHLPVLDDLGLVPAIEAAARGSDSAVPIEVRIEDRTGYSAYERPPADVELGLFRMVQESLANAVRHSRAQSITVSGDVGADAVRLTVADDGTGIPRARAEAALREGHLGISSIRQRAAGIDAAVDIDSREGGGTRVRIRWPA
ncbi:MAG: ATP-binding protein [Chloroflexota bacterium]